MSDFAAPSGPPPPKVPAGWKAVWNAEYKEWFYVNTFTKKSQWDKPTEPVYGDDAPPGGPPPGYDHSTSKPTGAEKGALGSNNPYGGSASTHDDEALARKLQAEEEAKAKAGGSSDRGAADSYYQGGSQGNVYGQQSSSAAPYGQSQGFASPQTSQGGDQKRGFFSKLMGKSSGGRPPQQQGYGGYPNQGYPPQQQYPPQGYGGYPQQNYYPPQGGYQQQPQRHGMGGMGGAVLGAGAGLVGGALLMDAIEDHDQNEYNQGFQNGEQADNGGYGGDDGGYGGDDGGFGGDDGGGDF